MRWIVYFDIYDTRGTLLKHDSDNDVSASTAIMASNIVRMRFHRSSEWSHVKIRITGAKVYGNQPKSVSGMKDYIVVVAYDPGNGPTKYQSTNLMAKNKTDAVAKVRKFLKEKYPKAKPLAIKANEVNIV